MRNDVLIRITQIDCGLEYLDLLPRDLRPAQTADQFLALAAEHRAGDDFYPARVARLTFQFFDSFPHFISRYWLAATFYTKMYGGARKWFLPRWTDQHGRIRLTRGAGVVDRTRRGVKAPTPNDIAFFCVRLNNHCHVCL